MTNRTSAIATNPQSDQPIYVYRGVHGKHPALQAARRGVVFPGDPKGSLTPEEHNIFDESAASQFTSWTYRLEIARTFAASRGPGGVILRLRLEASNANDTWSWEQSPDFHHESEILLKGTRIDAEVIE
jgi:hypothetical protein